jgi:hypothetical protein
LPSPQGISSTTTARQRGQSTRRIEERRKTRNPQTGYVDPIRGARDREECNRVIRVETPAFGGQEHAGGIQFERDLRLRFLDRFPVPKQDIVHTVAIDYQLSGHDRRTRAVTFDGERIRGFFPERRHSLRLKLPVECIDRRLPFQQFGTVSALLAEFALLQFRRALRRDSAVDPCYLSRLSPEAGPQP